MEPQLTPLGNGSAASGFRATFARCSSAKPDRFAGPYGRHLPTYLECVRGPAAVGRRVIITRESGLLKAPQASLSRRPNHTTISSDPRHKYRSVSSSRLTYINELALKHRLDSPFFTCDMLTTIGQRPLTLSEMVNNYIVQPEPPNPDIQEWTVEVSSNEPDIPIAPPTILTSTPSPPSTWDAWRTHQWESLRQQCDNVGYSFEVPSGPEAARLLDAVINDLARLAAVFEAATTMKAQFEQLKVSRTPDHV